MRLSDVAGAGSIDIVRDGAFETLGFLSDPQPAMLVFLEHGKFVPSLRRVAEAACVITTPELARKIDASCAVATSPTPRWAFHRIQSYLAGRTAFYWKNFRTVIHKSARVHPRAFVAARNVRIGAGSVVEPGAMISEHCIVGRDVTIRAGAVLGSAGFLSTRSADRVEEMPHAGGVSVEDGAHILANAVVAPAIFRGFTTVGPQARVGNCACVSHSVQIGTRSYIGHGSVVCGYVRIGDDVWIGPGATLANNMSVGDRAHVTMGAVVVRDVKAGQRVTGNFAVAHRALLRHVASLR